MTVLEDSFIVCNWSIDEFEIRKEFYPRMGVFYIKSKTEIDEDEFDEEYEVPDFSGLTKDIKDAYSSDSLHDAKDIINKYIHYWKCKQEIKPTKIHKLCD